MKIKFELINNIFLLSTDCRSFSDHSRSVEKKKTFIRGKMFNIFWRHFNDFACDIWVVNFNFPSFTNFFFLYFKDEWDKHQSCGNKKIKNCPFASNGQQKNFLDVRGELLLWTHMYNINSLEGNSANWKYYFS